jgi:hypothetical protein
MAGTDFDPKILGEICPHRRCVLRDFDYTLKSQLYYSSISVASVLLTGTLHIQPQNRHYGFLMDAGWQVWVWASSLMRRVLVNQGHMV